jgi:molybdenum cofactor synthesis domain-containing protein
MVPGIPTAAIVPIGDEVLRGETSDSNGAFLAAELSARGVEVRRILTLPDELELLAVELRALLAAHDIVITTGGIGPTPDDVTRQAVALALDTPLVLHEEAAAAYAEKIGRPLNEGQLEMCRLPAGCELIPHSGPGPAGCRIGKLLMLPGVPSIMRDMWDYARHAYNGPQVLSASIETQVPESRFSALMSSMMQRHPQVKFGSYPQRVELGWRVELRLRSVDAAALEAARSEFSAGLAELESLARPPDA